jgi:tetratricopeptide (TPR) repeat protein
MAIKNLFSGIFVFSQLFITCNNTHTQRKDEIALPPIGWNEQIDTNGMSARAWQYYLKENFMEAQAILDTLVIVDSNNGEWYYKRAYCKALQLEHDSEAIADYKMAIKQNYRRESSLFNIGFIYQTMEKFDSAQYFYEHLLKEFPSNAKAKEQLREIWKNLNKAEK